jgi:hypothetical protein
MLLPKWLDFCLPYFAYSTHGHPKLDCEFSSRRPSDWPWHHSLHFHATAAWKTTTINDITYVPLADYAAAFRMQPAKKRKDKRELAFTGENHQLVVKTGTREAIIDGVRHWLSFPVISGGGKAYVSLADINATLRTCTEPRLCAADQKVTHGRFRSRARRPRPRGEKPLRA